MGLGTPSSLTPPAPDRKKLRRSVDAVYKLCLFSDDLADSRSGEVKERIQLLPGEGLSLGRSLDLEESASFGLDNVQVDAGPGIFRIVKIEEGLASNDSYAHGTKGLYKGPDS